MFGGVHGFPAYAKCWSVEWVLSTLSIQTSINPDIYFTQSFTFDTRNDYWSALVPTLIC